MPAKSTKPSPAAAPQTSPKSNYIYAVGRRKQAVARVRLYPKKDTKSTNLDILVNDKPIGQYFPDPTTQLHYSQPLTLTQTVNRYSITIKVTGSGLPSQLDAIKHGISRALIKADEEHKPVLRKAGLLTRDPRKKQRRMIGKGGKARAQKQSPKR